MVHGSGDDGSRWFSLDFNVKTEVTGEADHQQLESIEVIFGQYEQIAPDALRLCRRLRSLTRTSDSAFSLHYLSTDWTDMSSHQL